MIQIALKDLTLLQVLDALPHLVVQENTETFVYDVTFDQTDDRIPASQFWIKIAGSQLSSGEGESGDPDATGFQVIQGGVDTILAMQMGGLRAAMNLMIMGYIFPSDIPKAEAWFRIFKTGEKETLEALKLAGFEITDADLPLLKELSMD